MGSADLLSGNDLLQMYRWMVLTRAFEDKAGELWAAGQVFEIPHGSQGQEAIAVGTCFGLRSDDQVLPSLRTRGAFFVKGVPPREHMAGIFARVTGPAGSRATAHHSADVKRGVLLGSGLIGASITVATGAALALKLQHRDSVVIDFFGDGAAQRGDFHESLNFAGVFKLPIVYVLENNGFAEMTPVAKHFAGPDFACRAQGYGFLGVQVDGNDVLAVYEATQSAIARARAGEGPTLLECITYRMRGHTESDSPTWLRDPAELEAWRTKDPIDRLRSLIQERDPSSLARLSEIDRDVSREIEEAVAFALQSPPPTPGDLYRNVYTPSSPDVVEGRE